MCIARPAWWDGSNVRRMLRPILIIRPGRSMRRPYMGKIKNKGMVTIYGSASVTRLTFFDSHDKIKVELS
jgi:hypothetical protein